MRSVRTVVTLVFIAFLLIPTGGYGKEGSMGIAEVNGTRLYYETKGDGEALVFIHSGGLDRRIWDDQFETFASRYRVIRYDVRGHGKSRPPTKPYSDEEDLYQLLKFLGVGKAHLVGLSVGGRIAIDFALVHPEMTASLVIAASSPSGYPFSPQDMQEIMKVVWSIRNDDGSPAGDAWLQSPFNAPAMENPEVARKLRPIAVENSRYWLVNPLFPRPPFPPAIQRLGEIRVSTLLIMGDRDLPAIGKAAEVMETGIKGARKLVVPAAGHVLPMEKPQEFNRALLAFLASQNR